MYRIVRIERLHDTVSLIEVEAPYVARKALPGQFIVLRIDEKGERIPLTIADYDREKGTATVIFQKVGATTKRLDLLEEGDYLMDFAGPLGKASEFDHLKGKKAAVVAGGLGVAIAYPQAKALNAIGADVDAFIVFIVDNTFRIILYSALGLLTFDTVLSVLKLIPFALLGLFLGIKCSNHMDGKNVKKITSVLLVLSGH